MNQRKINSIQSNLARLARDQCASYKEGGLCDIQRCGLCVVGIKTDSLPGNVCSYFMRSVLPADAKLFDEYLDYFPQGYPLKKDRPNMKPCQQCGDLFEKRSNAAKYCEHCKTVVKRRQTVESNRKNGK